MNVWCQDDYVEDGQYLTGQNCLGAGKDARCLNGGRHDIHPSIIDFPARVQYDLVGDDLNFARLEDMRNVELRILGQCCESPSAASRT
jgi:hypothetical protein